MHVPYNHSKCIKFHVLERLFSYSTVLERCRGVYMYIRYFTKTSNLSEKKAEFGGLLVSVITLIHYHKFLRTIE